MLQNTVTVYRYTANEIKRETRRTKISHEKVNQYKESKKNRKEAVKKEKQKSFLTKLGLGVVGLALVVWLGYSAVVTIQNAEGPAVAVDSSAITEYVSTLEE